MALEVRFVILQLSNSQEHIEKLQKYQEMVEETIDLHSDPHSWVLLPSLDNDLQRLRDELNEVTVQLDAEHKRVGKDLGVELDKKLHLENHQVYKYSFRITKAVSRRYGTSALLTIRKQA